MVLATLLPVELSALQRSHPNSHLASVHQFLLAAAAEVDELVVFHLSADPSPHVESAKKPSNLFEASASELSEWLGSRSIDVWHDFGFQNPHALVALRARACRPFCISFEGPAEQLIGSGPSDDLPLGAGDASIYWCESHLELARLRAKSIMGRVQQQGGQWERRVIAPGLNIASIHAMAKSDARSLLGYGDREIIVLCYMKLNTSSRADLLPLIDGIHAAAATGHNIRLIIGGPAHQAVPADFNELARTGVGKAKVSFLLNPVPPVVPLLYSAADIFVQASDGMSKDDFVTTVYAMGHGLPVAIAKYSFASAVVEDGKSGILIDSYVNHQALAHCRAWFDCVAPETIRSIACNARGMQAGAVAQALVPLISSLERRRFFGLEAYKRAQHALDLRKVVTEHLGLWRELAANTSRSRTVDCPSPDGTLEKGPFSFKTESIRLQARVKPTARGLSVLNQRLVRIPRGWRECIYAPVVIKILDLAKDGEAIETVIDGVRDWSDASPSSVFDSGMLYHIGWCLNEGLLNPEETAA